VLPGYATDHEQDLKALTARAGVTDDVRFIGWLPGPEIEGLWSLASAFVYPSLYEGFGLPVLEAMARGVPVASSQASSLPEVAGDAAVLFEPTDEQAIAAALVRLLDDQALRARLVERGREQVREFTWRRAAELTLASYERALA
jgi:glycosyltransferase involved in cell wall biosynthesis